MKILENQKNMTIIKETSDTNAVKYTLFSYNALIATYYSNDHYLELTSKWNYSQTTLKHFKYFINEFTCFIYDTKKEFEKVIEKNNDKIMILD